MPKNHRQKPRRTGTDPEYTWVYELFNKLIDKRIELGITQKTVAERMVTSPQFVYNIETLYIVPSIHFITRYAKALGVKILTEVEVNEHQDDISG